MSAGMDMVRKSETTSALLDASFVIRSLSSCPPTCTGVRYYGRGQEADELLYQHGSLPFSAVRPLRIQKRPAKQITLIRVVGEGAWDEVAM